MLTQDGAEKLLKNVDAHDGHSDADYTSASARSSMTSSLADAEEQALVAAKENIQNVMATVFATFQTGNPKAFSDAIFYDLTHAARIKFKLEQNDAAIFQGNIEVAPLLQHEQQHGKTLLDIILETTTALSDDQKAKCKTALGYIGSSVFADSTDNDSLKRAFEQKNADVIELMIEQYDTMANLDATTVVDEQGEKEDIIPSADQIYIAKTARARIALMSVNETQKALIEKIRENKPIKEAAKEAADTKRNIEKEQKELDFAKRVSEEKLGRPILVNSPNFVKSPPLQKSRWDKNSPNPFSQKIATSNKIGMSPDLINSQTISPSFQAEVEQDKNSSSVITYNHTTQSKNLQTHMHFTWNTKHIKTGAALGAGMMVLGIASILITAYFPDSFMGARTGKMDGMRDDLASFASWGWNQFGTSNPSTQQHWGGQSSMLCFSASVLTFGAAVAGAAIGAMTGVKASKKI